MCRLDTGSAASMCYLCKLDIEPTCCRNSVNLLCHGVSRMLGMRNVYPLSVSRVLLDTQPPGVPIRIPPEQSRYICLFLGVADHLTKNFFHIDSTQRYELLNRYLKSVQAD